MVVGGRQSVGVREIALLGVALLAAVVAIAVTSRTSQHQAPSPQPVGNYTALAGSAGPAVTGKRTACGGVLGPGTLGIAHPTLPCGARIFITFGGHTVLAQVVDRGPYRGGREFDVTVALATRLGLHGVQLVHWSYARN